MKLSLRELFGLVLVSAILCAWWLEHKRLTEKIQHLETSFEERAAEERLLGSIETEQWWRETTRDSTINDSGRIHIRNRLLDRSRKNRASAAMSGAWAD